MSSGIQCLAGNCRNLIVLVLVLVRGLERPLRHRFEVKTLCWTFDHARIHLTRRPDGAALAVFSENIPGEPPNEGAQHLLAAFHESGEV